MTYNAIMGSYKKNKAETKANTLYNIAERNERNMKKNSIFSGSNDQATQNALSLAKADKRADRMTDLATLAGVTTSAVSFGGLGLSVFSAFKDAKAAKGQPNSPQAPSNIESALNSYDPEVLQPAYDQGTKESDNLKSQADGISAQIASSETSISTATRKESTLKGEITKDSASLKSAKDSVAGDKSSASLTGKMNSEIGKVQKTIKDQNGKDIPNPNYEKQVQAIKLKYEKPIKKAKEIEDAIPGMETSLGEKKKTLEITSGFIKTETKKKENAEKELKSLNTRKSSLDSNIVKIKTKLDTIKGFKQNDTAKA